MTLTEEGMFNIADILKKESVTIHYQPVISIKKKAVIGVEALCRGIDPETGGLIPPDVLFSLARPQGLAVDLDRLCRKKALEGYKKLYVKNRDLILFLNIDTSVINTGIVGSGKLVSKVRKLGINPGNVVIEIVESRISDITALNRFISSYKEYGFLIAMDDVGSGYSNLDRILLVKPDILKIDRSIVSDLDKKQQKQEVFKSLVNLSKRIGTLVVAEGVERKEEAILTLELGADMLQGYYYSAPRELKDIKITGYDGEINNIATMFRNYMVHKINAVKLLYREYGNITDGIIHDLSQATMENFNNVLKGTLDHFHAVECVYVLNESGIQVTDTFCNIIEIPGHKKLFFRPARRGTDHSLKDYYYLPVNTGQSRYTTDPYISLASGNLCITISSLFTDRNNNRFILCVDINSAGSTGINPGPAVMSKREASY